MELQRKEQKTNTDLKLNSAGVKFLERYQREKVEEMVDTAKIAPETVKILNALTLGLESLTLDSIFSSVAKGKNDNRQHDRLPGATKEQSKADQDDIALTKEIEEFMSTVLKVIQLDIDREGMLFVREVNSREKDSRMPSRPIKFLKHVNSVNHTYCNSSLKNKIL